MPLGWPFLVARGRHTDYQTIVAPDFLVEAGAYGVLSDSVSRRDMQVGEVRVLTLNGAEAPTITVSYTRERLDPGFTVGQGSLSDEQGRPMEILYGVVTRDRPVDGLEQADLRQARETCLLSYRAFLADERGARVDPSVAFTLHAVTAERHTRTLSTTPGPSVPLTSRASQSSTPPPTSRPSGPRTPPPPPRLPHLKWLGLSAAGLIVAVALFLLIYPIPRHVNVTVVGGSPVLLSSCAAPITLRGAITTDGAGTVRYHWETGGRTVVPFRDLPFKAAATIPVNDTSDGTVGAQGQAIAYTLVVDSPASPRRRATYRVTC